MIPLLGIYSTSWTALLASVGEKATSLQETWNTRMEGIPICSEEKERVGWRHWEGGSERDVMWVSKKQLNLLAAYYLDLMKITWDQIPCTYLLYLQKQNNQPMETCLVFLGFCELLLKWVNKSASTRFVFLTVYLSTNHELAFSIRLLWQCTHDLLLRIHKFITLYNNSQSWQCRPMPTVWRSSPFYSDNLL